LRNAKKGAKMATPALAGGARENQNTRLRPAQLQADMDAHTALQAISNYAPANSAYAKTAVETKFTVMKGAQDAELAAQNALAAARDSAAAAEWEFHNALLGVKDQVIAQYGDNSDELQSLGLKKKSEYKTPKPKAKAA
jgi:hypothetical protein